MVPDRIESNVTSPTESSAIAMSERNQRRSLLRGKAPATLEVVRHPLRQRAVDRLFSCRRPLCMRTVSTAHRLAPVARFAPTWDHRDAASFIEMRRSVHRLLSASSKFLQGRVDVNSGCLPKRAPARILRRFRAVDQAADVEPSALRWRPGAA